jgi:hypothetical protein
MQGIKSAMLHNASAFWKLTSHKNIAHNEDSTAANAPTSCYEQRDDGEQQGSQVRCTQWQQRLVRRLKLLSCPLLLLIFAPLLCCSHMVAACCM